MKKILILLFCNFVVLHSHDFIKYEEENIKTFNVGTEATSFRYIKDVNPVDPWGPNSLSFDTSGYLYINDTWNLRLTKLNKNFDIIEQFDLDATKFFYSAGQIHYNDGIFYGNDFNENFSNFDLSKNKTTFILDLSNTKWKQEIQSGNFYIIENNIFFNLENKNWLLFHDLGLDNDVNIRNIYTGDGLNNFLISEERNNNSSLSGLRIEKEFLIKDNKLLTRDFQTFISYWKEINNSKVKHKKAIDLSYSRLLEYSNVSYLGVDKDGNSYWKSGRKRIFISNNEGWIIDGFLINSRIAKTTPTVHPDGDLYFLGYDSDDLQLYRIKRQW